MATWLTYLAALLMAGATALTFSSSTVFLNIMSSLTSLMTNIGLFLFIPITFVTFMAGTASLKKDRIGGKTVRINIVWALITSLILAISAVLLTSKLSLSLPVTASTGGNYVELFSSYSEKADPIGTLSLINSIYPIVIVLAFVFGCALTPSSDIIRPAYAVINSFSEVMYRIERTVTYFGSIYVYIASTSFFLSLWQEKTAFVSPSFFLYLLGATAILVLVVLPLLFGIFTGFRKNPYGIIGKGLSSLIFAFMSGNIYLTEFQSAAINRNSLGVQKRIVSTTLPLGVFITRGGTCFVSTVTVLSLLRALNADVSVTAAAVIALTSFILSFTSFMSASSEVAFISFLVLKMLNINVYGAEAMLISILPFLNGLAVLLDTLLINMASSIVAKRTKTDITVPVRDAI